MKLKKFALVPLFACTAYASAAGLLGTTGSFATSSFCKTYGCRLENKTTVSPGIVDWRYSLNTEFPEYESDPVRTRVTIRRVNNRIVSANWVSMAQDYVFYSDMENTSFYNTDLAISLTATMTGKGPRRIYLASLNKACDGNPQLQTVPWNVAGKAFALSCRMDNTTWQRALAFRFFITAR